MDKQFQKIRRGDIAAFEQVFREHYEALFRFAYRFIQNPEEAEEIVQEVFVALWEKRQSLQIDTSISSYLYASVRNRALNVLKSAYHQKNSPLETLNNDEISATPKEAENDRAELIDLVRRGIETLPEKCRHIFTLSRQAGLTYEEIAEELGVSKETVKSQIKIAIRKLRQFVEKHGYLWQWSSALIMLRHFL